jgi:NADPH:quinone reductase-like Zn-dependent oxidoreductase
MRAVRSHLDSPSEASIRGLGWFVSLDPRAGENSQEALVKAIRIHSFGGPEVLTLDEIAVPDLLPGEILIRIGAASVNPVDYKIRRGGYPKITAAQLPITLGRDICGVSETELTGDTRLPAGEGCAKGDAVYALPDWRLGGYAEYVALPSAFCAPKPKRLSTVESAAVPLAALTAWQGIFDCGGLVSGQTILIHAAAGGVGHFAVQFAKAAGAYVFATAAAENIEFVRQLGADVVIDYKVQRFEDTAKNLDVVFDLVGGETRDRSWQTLRRGGILVSTLGQPDEAKAGQYGVRAKGYTAQPNRGQLIEIGRLIDSNKVRPTVTRSYPLQAAREAQTFLESSHPRGKVVLAVAPG